MLLALAGYAIGIAYFHYNVLECAPRHALITENAQGPGTLGVGWGSTWVRCATENLVFPLFSQVPGHLVTVIALSVFAAARHPPGVLGMLAGGERLPGDSCSRAPAGRERCH